MRHTDDDNDATMMTLNFSEGYKRVKDDIRRLTGQKLRPVEEVPVPGMLYVLMQREGIVRCADL